MKKEVVAEIIDSLKENNIDFVASVPEGHLHELVVALEITEDIKHVAVTREEEGVGVCAGAYLGGKRPALLTMNNGFLMTGNALATVCFLTGIPLLLLIGHTGAMGEHFHSHTVTGKLTEPMLHALGIEYEKVGSLKEIKPAIRNAHNLTRAARRPVALLFYKEALR
jgi:sulfopyruvate decarboxylase subunit alpha